jgi:mycothiol synthase
MQPTFRSYQTEDDYWRIRNFLREVFVLNGRREHSWHVARLDYWRWHFVLNLQVCDPLDKVISIWETADGQIAAVLHPVGWGEVRLHMHPHFRTAALEDEMLTYAEEHLSDRSQPGKQLIHVPVFSADAQRQQVLAQRGYSRLSGRVHHWRQDLDAPIPESSAAPGYAIRAMGELAEHPARSWASWRAFHADEPATNYDGDWSWYQNLQSAPLYRRDLDMVAAAPNGDIAAFSTFYYDDFSRSAVAVLVGTAAEYQRRGLGRAVMFEGLRRLKRLGCTRVFANAYDRPADVFYQSVLGTKEVSETWFRELQMPG